MTDTNFEVYFSSPPMRVMTTALRLPIEIVYALLSLVALALVYMLTASTKRDVSHASHPGGPDKELPPQGYILHTSVTHARLLPVEAKHAFTYPALFVLVGLRALEEGRLDTGVGFGCRCGVGGKSKRRLTLMGISSKGYLSNTGKEETGILQRLEGLLRDRSCLGEMETVDDAWMLTMPSLVGWEGINPLTVYFVFTREEGVEGGFKYAVLEIHNTFGESHVHILEVGKGEDAEAGRTRGYDHQWTFAREFHVSPFNDRSGWYTVAVKRPSYGPGVVVGEGLGEMKPAVSVKLYTDRPPPNQSSPPNTSSTMTISPTGPLKLTALLRPITAVPLNTTNDVVKSLGRMPFELLMTMPRILYQAGVLCFRKGLSVYLRPEMPEKSAETGAGDLSTWGGKTRGGGIRWLSEGVTERYARVRVEEFVAARVESAREKMKVVFRPANPALSTKTWESKQTGVNQQQKPHADGKWVEARYQSSKFFTDLLVSPTPKAALEEGARTGVWRVVESERGCFEELFSNGRDVICGSDPTSESTKALSLSQTIRVWASSVLFKPVSPTGEPGTRIPKRHFLDSGSRSVVGEAVGIAAVLFKVGLELLERGILWSLGVRIAEPNSSLDRPDWMGSVYTSPSKSKVA